MLIRDSLVPFLIQEDGTTAVEYCVMLGLILLAMLVGIVAAGNGVRDWWDNINSEMTANGV
ncbi:MAG: Flp family type IVb pilin [Planctomycetaceae bacterium]